MSITIFSDPVDSVTVGGTYRWEYTKSPYTCIITQNIATSVFQAVLLRGGTPVYEIRSDVMPVYTLQSAADACSTKAQLLSVSDKKFQSKGVIDLTQAPYSLVANDRSASTRNTVAINQAIVDAVAGGYELYAPGGVYYFAWNGEAADGKGVTGAIKIPQSAAFKLSGAGMQNTVFCYANNAGAYGAVMYKPVTVDGGGQPVQNFNTGLVLQDLHIKGADDVAGGSAEFCVNLRWQAFSEFSRLRLSGSRNVALLGDTYYGCTFKACLFDSLYGSGVFLRLSNSDQFYGCGFGGIAGVGMLLAYCSAMTIESSLFEGIAQAAIALNGCQQVFVKKHTYMESICSEAGPDKNLNYPDTGIQILHPGTLTPWFKMYGAIVILNGALDASDLSNLKFAPDVSHEWAFTYAAYEPYTSTIEGLQTTLNHENIAVVATNSAPNLTIRDCTHFGASRGSTLIAGMARIPNGLVHPFRVERCRNYSTIYKPLLGGPWDSQAVMGEVHTTYVDDATPYNVLSNDPIADLSIISIDADATADTRCQLIRDTSDTYVERGVRPYTMVGPARSAAIGVMLDLSGKHAYLAGKLIGMSARCFATANVSNGWDNVIGFKAQEPSGAFEGTFFGWDFQVAHTTGWVTRGTVIQLPTSGKCFVGYGKKGEAPLPVKEFAIYELGVGHDRAIDATRADSEWRTALSMQNTRDTVYTQLAADGTVTLEGVSFTASSMANVRESVRYGGGIDGISFKPNSSTSSRTNPMTAPRLSILLKNLIPGYEVGMPFRVWLAYDITAPGDANGNFFAGLYDGTLLGKDVSGEGGGYLITSSALNTQGVKDALSYSNGVLAEDSSVTETTICTGKNRNCLRVTFAEPWVKPPVVACGTYNPYLNPLSNSNYVGGDFVWPTDLRVLSKAAAVSQQAPGTMYLPGITRDNATLVVGAEANDAAATTFQVRLLGLRVDYKR